MSWRRLPMLLVVLAVGVTLFLVGRTTPAPLQALFAEFDRPGMPALPEHVGLTETWFCPGVPGGAVEGASDQGGRIVIANSSTAPVSAVVTTLTVDQPAAEQTVEIGAGARQEIDVAEGSASPYVAAVVEVAGGEAVVEQVASHPEGDSVAPCSASTSTNWYFADGFTADDSTEHLVVTNPYDQAAVVDFSFVTDDGPRQPSALQGYPIPPQSVRVIDVAGSGMADEASIGVRAAVSAGQVVVGRAQVYAGGGRRGYSMTVGAPQIRDQWWFAFGERTDGVAEEYRLFNPTDTDVEVTPVFLGVPLVQVDPIEVPAGRVASFAVDDAIEVDDGPHAMVFSTTSTDLQTIVVDQVLTRTVDNRPTTSVIVGATSRPSDGFIASSWFVGSGVAEPTEAALAVYNPDLSDATVTVNAVGPTGLTPIASLTDIALPGSSVITIDLTDPEAVDRELVVVSTGRIFAERMLRREEGSEGRVSSWAIPAGA